MLRSMTGFGRGLAENKSGRIKIEIKSLNYKFFEVVNRLPANLAIFEDSIREYLQKKISRGRLNLFLSYEKGEAAQDEVYIDKAAGKKYYEMILSLKKSLGLGGEINIGQIISLPGVIAYHPREEDPEGLWPLVKKALAAACADLIHSKIREGKMLKKGLKHIIESAESSLEKVKSRAPAVARGYRTRLLKNVKELTSSKRIFNPQRIEEEAAIFARNCDITEEIHRTASHVASFKKVLSDHGEVGRRLDFIAQEMHREANTIGAKANDFPISKEVIKIKSLVDKIREQVQNVE